MDADGELEAYQHTLAQAVRADELGWHSVWSVEHHFLEEYSHCPNPEVLYGAIAARTERLRIGYGVRLVPRPYNHPSGRPSRPRCSTCSRTAGWSSAPGGRRPASRYE